MIALILHLEIIVAGNSVCGYESQRILSLEHTQKVLRQAALKTYQFSLSAADMKVINCSQN